MSTTTPAVSPQAYRVLDAAERGRVRWQREDETVHMLQSSGFGSPAERVDVTGCYAQLRQAEWVVIVAEDFDADRARELPVEPTPAGEDALMEWRAAQRKRQQRAKGGKR